MISTSADSVQRATARKRTPSALTGTTRAQDPRAVLERARAAYVGQQMQEAAQVAGDLVARLRRSRNRTADSDEILGSACTLLGLIKCLADDCRGARPLFAAAVKAFGRLSADRLTGSLGATAADYGIALQQTGDHLGAKTALLSALELGANTPDVRRHLGAACRDLGLQERADQVLSDAVARAPLDWQAREWLAALHEDLGHGDAEISREWEDAGRLLREAGLIQRAARAYQRSVRLRPHDADLLLTAAEVLADAGARHAAAKLLLTGLDLPITVSARLKFAELLLDVGRGDVAQAVCRAVLETEPDNDQAAVDLAWSLVTQKGGKGFEEATQVLTRTLQAHPESVDARALLGEVARLQGRYSAAIGLFDEALAVAGGTGSASAFLYGSKGQALRSLGQTADAIQELRHATELDPDLPWVHVELAAAYRSTDLDAEIGELREALRLLPTDVEIKAGLGAALAEKAQRVKAAGMGGEDIATEAEGLLRQVLAPTSFRPGVLGPLVDLLLAEGDDADALAVLKQAEKAVPGDLDVQTVHARVLYQTGRYDDAARLLSEGLAEDPSRLDDWALLGETERMQGNLPAAIEHLNRLITARPTDTWALSSRAAAYVDAGDPEQLTQAEKDLRRCLEADPGNLFTLNTLRSLLISQRRYDEAVTAFRTAVEQTNASKETVREYGETLRQAGRFTEARDALDDALWKDPQDPETRRALGWVLLDLHQPREAMTNFELAAQNSPDPAAMYEALTARILSGEYEDTLQRLNRWLATHPGDGDAWRLTSWLYLRVGAWPQCLSAAQRAVQAAADDATCHELLGLALLRTHHDPERALEEFREGIRLVPGNPWLRRGYVQGLWTAGEEEEARAILAEMRDMLDRGLEEDADVLALRGWCLSYLGHPDEAVIAYKKALLAGRWELSVIAFGLAVACLIGDDSEGVASALNQAWHSLDGEPPLRRRGIIAATLADLMIAGRFVPRIRESQIAKELEQYMEERLADLPVISPSLE